MLRSFDQEDHHNDHLHRHPTAAVALLPPPQPRQLLLRCAELISSNDIASAHCILSYLRSTAACSPYGDSADRLVYLFTKALSLHLTRRHAPSNTPILDPDFDLDVVNSAYLSLNQVTPFLRFSHLTANQAILEAVAGHSAVHIVDFNLLQGLQWPPLMQALVTASNPNRPTTLRLTAAGPDPNQLHKTGSRLRKFAVSLGLKFHFYPVHLSARDPDPVSLISSVAVFPGEALAVNAVHFLHRFLHVDRSSSSTELALLLDRIRSVGPRVVTLAEREAGHVSGELAVRVSAGMEYYSAVLESMEATLPPNSKERMAVEQAWFGREIGGVVAGSVRHARFGAWEEVMRESGFESVGLSGFSVSQAKLLLRLHYPSEGYRLQVVEEGKCIFLGWKNTPLFSVSAWR